MKKALWLQLPRYKLAEQIEQSLDELAQYQRNRFVPTRRSARAQQELVYQARVREWLRQPENRWCRVSLVLSGRRVAASQCHHYQGRRGMLLLYEPFWIPVSWVGHRWIDEHRQRARELGLLCPMGRYNSALGLKDPGNTTAGMKQ